MKYICKRKMEAKVYLQTICNLVARREWVVNTKLRPLYPREVPDTHCTGDWMCLGAGLDWIGKSRPHQDKVPGPSSP
jgi:hypothetical protein